MSSFSETHLPCSSCGSSDARSIYQSGVSKCFSCGETLAPEGTRAPTTSAPTRKIAPLRRELEFHPLPSRGITVETARRYGYAIDTDGTHCAPYHDSSRRIVDQKLRKREKT